MDAGGTSGMYSGLMGRVYVRRVLRLSSCRSQVKRTLELEGSNGGEALGGMTMGWARAIGRYWHSCCLVDQGASGTFPWFAWCTELRK
jgi:hypothetical protein